MFTKSAVAALLLANTQATTVNQTKIAEIMQGITTQYGGHFNLEALLACIGEEDKAALVFDAAYSAIEEAIQEKDIGQAIGAVLLIVAGVQQAKQGLPACRAVDTSSFDFAGLQRDSSILSKPMEKIEMIEKDLLINGVSIMEDIEKAGQEYKAGQFEQFGETIAKIIKLFNNDETKQYGHQEWMSKRIQTPKAERLDRKDVASFAQGLFEATNVGTFNFTNLLICIYEADQEAEILDTAVHMIEKAYQDKDLEELIPAAIAIFAFVQGLQQTLVPCEAVDQSAYNWNTLNNIVSTIENPKNYMKIIGEDIVFNGKTITKDLFNANESLRSGNFFGFGQSLGTTMKDTCEPEHSLFLY